MSAHELTVLWPAYFAYRNAAQEREQRMRELESPLTRTMGGGR